MNRRRYFVAALAFGLLLSGQTGRCLAAGNDKVVIQENITYGKAGDTELKLDLARPEGDGPFPAIVFIHGGGWYQGNRQGYSSLQDESWTWITSYLCTS